ncbi:hypothetical protein [Listeria sp. PSOL-1]|uniref:hypothetical protein n=1 Tax=Listeria sp. PSOL-1 TaxID=1844999 RepID=UPI0013D0F89D|nr:hypothetical protein [Listeria sp. PSOL-1]
MIIFSLSFILIIEISQFVIGASVGFMFRVFDVDDIIVTASLALSFLSAFDVSYFGFIQNHKVKFYLD